MTSHSRLRRGLDAPHGPDTPRHTPQHTGQGPGQGPAPDTGGRPPGPPAPEDLLVRIQDLAGRPRGTGFLADHHGTVITSHEAVDGLPRLVLRAPDDRHCVVGADAVTALPALDLALVRTDGLGLDPLPVTARDRVDSGTYVTLAAGCWREARVLGATTVTYTATDRFHRLDDALELAIGTAGRDALRLGGGAAGGPVLDAGTGAVLGVLGTALRSPHRDTGFAVPLRSPAPATAEEAHPGRSDGTPAGARRADGPLAALLARNATTVPAYGADLNLAGVLHLTATSVAQDGPAGVLTGDTTAPGGVPRIERARVTTEFTAFEQGPAAVLGLVGPPGSGRTTELAAYAARRHRDGRPTLWLRGADLHEDDASLADAARRALDRAARIAAASRSPFPAGPDGLGDTGPERLAALARAAGRPLTVLLDGPEEMPPVLAHRLAAWTDGTARWLRTTGIRLVVACRPEFWENAAPRFPAGLLHTPRDAAYRCDQAPARVSLGDLSAEEARRARAHHGLPDGVLGGADARHPLALRLLAEVRDALGGPPGVPVDRDDLFSAHLDLMCLRVAVRLAAENGLRGTAVRRLATRVAGQVHEAARRSLGPGQGELERAAFEELFPWGPAPAHLGGGTGWATAVLTEGVLVPAGSGYRFAHEEFADWIQGVHLDLDEALRALVHAPRTADDPDRVPVPHHRAGPVVEALVRLGRRRGTGPLASRLADLVHALDADPASWWAARLLSATLTRVPDATPYTAVLGLLAHRVAAWRQQHRPVPADLGPDFWSTVPLPPDTRFALLRRLVPADGPPCETGPRFLDAAARLLTADPVAVIPQLVRWFDDERALPATPHATVATAAQVLLHTHRDRASDALTDALADSAHRRAGQLLAVLAEEEPGAVCRAVHRWAHDERSARRAAAAAHGLRVVPYVRDGADRALLRQAALALLDRTDDPAPHGGALALLVRDPHTRDRHLARALEHFAAGDPQLPPDALTGALITHPGPVLAAFGTRLGRADAAETLRVLGDATTPGLAGRVAALLRDAVRRRPELAGHLAAYADRRLNGGPAAQDVLFPLLTGLLDGGPAPLRAALAGLLADPGTPASRPLRRVLLDTLLAREQDPDVLTAVLHAAARTTGPELRDLVHRTGLLLARTPEGAARLDRALAGLARHVPGFAAALAGWLADAPGVWAPLIGTGARRTVEDVVGTRVPV
ncbi:trypsin-like peptidase domain-containing protein [Streptomyces sp. enrichment culture]|uniref:trypsin-like peptidase domain-containing protein n=1 Tax=Streptomyces sp. enrichment culture TaxID=1795815 RepID=UPI003F566273